MLIYSAIFIVILCFSFMPYWRREAYVIFMLVSLFLILFAGFKGDGVGFDYDNYVDNIYKSNELLFIEPGVLFVAKLLRPLNNATFFFLFFAVLSVSVKSIIIRNNAPFPMLAMLMYFSIYFLVQDMGQIRYGLAVGICALALICLANDEKSKFWHLVILAILFHFSALIVIPAYFLRNVKITKSLLFALLAASGLFLVYDISNIVLALANITPLGGVAYRILFYMENQDENGAWGLNLSLFLRISELLFFYYYLTKNKDDRYFNTLFNFFFYGVALYIVLNFNQEFSSRGAGYFKFLEVIMVPYVVFFIEKWYYSLIAKCSVVIYCLYSFCKFLLDPDVMDQYIPYSTMLL